MVKSFNPEWGCPHGQFGCGHESKLFNIQLVFHLPLDNGTVWNRLSIVFTLLKLQVVHLLTTVERGNHHLESSKLQSLY